MKYQTISKEELKSWLDTNKDLLLIDVLPPEFFNEQHIAGAKNAPVYEIKFLEYIEKLVTDKNKQIVLYNESLTSLAAEDAANKLIKAGYKNVAIFPGGLSKWREANWPLEIGERVRFQTPKDGKHEIDFKKSVVGWVGRNAKYSHHGKISVKNGFIEMQNQNFVGGEIVMDVKSIKDEDLTDENLRAVLEGHLKSSDFFDVENFPEAKFVFEKVEKISGVLAGEPNFNAKGMLTIKEISHPIEFEMMLAPQPDGSINGHAHFDFDRTLWNVRYGSEKFFEKLGMHLVNDMVTLELFLVTKLR